MSICEDSTGEPAASREPLVRVVRGAPTPDELAALVGVLLARRRPAVGMATPGLTPWARSARPVGRVARPGVGGWRLSGLPR